MNLYQIIPFLKDIITLANSKVMEIYNDDFDIVTKSDLSPLTAADLASNKIICDGLQILNKKLLKQNVIDQDILIISEENKNMDYNHRKEYKYAWLVDPIDGTKEFIKKNGEFTTNIGLVCDNKVIFGIVGIPAQNLIYWGGINIPSVKFDSLNNIMTNLTPRNDTDPFIVVTSRSHSNQDTLNCIDKLKQQYNNVKTVSSGSSIKMLMVAEGIANFYPRYGPTSEWDTCAAHGILKGVKMNLTDMFNNEILYNKDNILNPFFKTN